MEANSKSITGSSTFGYRKPVIRFLLREDVPPLIFVLILMVTLSLSTNTFLTLENIQAIFIQISVLGIVALAVNHVILSGEIDISVGSVIAICAFFYGYIATKFGGVLLPLLASLLIGALIGAINGLFVTKGRVPSFIVTLGTMNILRGIVLLTAGDLVINLPDDSRILGTKTFLGLNVSIFILIAAFLFIAFLNRHTTWGRDVMAVGGNKKAAEMIGLPVHRVVIGTFVLTGVCCGLAAVLFLSQIGQLQATAASGFELQVIASVVIGGTSIMGGKGSVYAPLIGAILIGTITNAMTILKVPGTYIDLALGAVILMAITTDFVRRRMVTNL
ncbi:monosaccharide ABC transporter membrane protein, CUT2 family [Seinonella peptonophila]|uniref:Autoinducer 2 import system permease protein LsrC n=2 Tax=Seinonella peptonophila TaxID=112248 RepID=A0A1M4Y800_9BACL|nr:monosaccharide ABC transporter membrane protein, CUT2 family [Seinonella peptonophila]